MYTIRRKKEPDVKTSLAFYTNRARCSIVSYVRRPRHRFRVFRTGQQQLQKKSFLIVSLT